MCCEPISLLHSSRVSSCEQKLCEPIFHVYHLFADINVAKRRETLKYGTFGCKKFGFRAMSQRILKLCVASLLNILCFPDNRCELSKRLWTFSRRMDTRWRLFKTSARLDRINAFKVEAWQPPDLPEIFNVFVQLLLADKGFHFLKTMKYEVTNIRRDLTTIPSRRSTKRSR